MLSNNDIIDILLKNESGGYYNMSERVVQYGEQEASILNSYISIHESLHEYLNNATIYGVIMQTYSYLYKNTNKLVFLKKMEQLVKNCRQTHEIYATFLGVHLSHRVQKGTHKVLATDFVKNNITYRNYFESGDYISNFFKTSLFKDASVNAVAYCCMQNLNLPNLINEVGFENFDLSNLNFVDYPDQRLMKILPEISDDFWQTVLNQFSIEYEHLPAIQSIIGLEKLGIELELGKDDEISALLYPFFYNAVFSLMKRTLNIDTVPFDNHIEVAHELLQLAYTIVPLSTAPFPMISHKATLTSREFALANQLQNEKMLFSSQKYEAVLVGLNQIPVNRWALLVCGNPKSAHFFLIFRTVEQLGQQYEFSNKDKEQLKKYEKTGVHCFRRKISKKVDTVIQHKIELITIEEPSLLSQIQERLSINVPIISNLSFYSFQLRIHHQSEWGRMIDNYTQSTILLDISLLSFYEFYKKKKLNDAALQLPLLHYYRVSIGEQGIEYDAVIFYDLYDKSLFIAPCSRVVSTGLTTFIKDLNETILVENKDFLYGELQFKILASLTHIIKEEHFFQFN